MSKKRAKAPTLQMIEVAAHKFTSQGKSRRVRAQEPSSPLWKQSHFDDSPTAITVLKLSAQVCPQLVCRAITPIHDWHVLCAGLSLSITSGVAWPSALWFSDWEDVFSQ